MFLLKLTRWWPRAWNSNRTCHQMWKFTFFWQKKMGRKWWSKRDYRGVQINRKPSCQLPPLGRARNNSVCNEVVMKRFPPALLQQVDRLHFASPCCWRWITSCSLWHQFCVNTEPKTQTWCGINVSTRVWLAGSFKAVCLFIACFYTDFSILVVSLIPILIIFRIWCLHAHKETWI